MQVREVHESDKPLFNAFVAQSPIGDLLQSFEWGDLKRLSGGWEPIRVVAEKEGAIVGAASVLKRRLPRVGRSIFYASRGPICDYSDPAVLRAMPTAMGRFFSRSIRPFEQTTPTSYPP